MSEGGWVVRVDHGKYQIDTDYGYEGIRATIGFIRDVVLPNRTGQLILTGGLPDQEEEVIERHEHDPEAPTAKVHALPPGVTEPEGPPIGGTYHGHCLMYATGCIDTLGDLSPFHRSDARHFADYCAKTPAVGVTISQRWAAWSTATRERREAADE